MARLKEGSDAPGFTKITPDGRGVNVDALLDEGKKIWLAFYRYEGCPLCQSHIYDVNARLPTLRKEGIEFVAIFESQPGKFYEKNSRAWPLVPMISDPKRELYDLYGLENKLFGLLHPMSLVGLIKALSRGFMQGPITGSLTTMPAHFLILPNGMIHTAHYGSSVGDHIAWWKVVKFMREAGGPGAPTDVGGTSDWDEKWGTN